MVSKVLTIIIPVFNGEKHIYRALECLKNQTWKNFSVLIINDNSTDNSVDIIKQYKDYLDLKIIDLKENQGVSYCRTLGIKKCNTPYVTFMDHDDWIDINTYEFCFKEIKDEIDIIIFGLSYEFLDINISEYKYVYNNIFSISGDYAIRIYGHTIKDNFKITPIVNNKIYKLKFLNDNSINFDKRIRYQEDDIFTFKALLSAKNIQFIPNCKYHYLQNSDSAIHHVSEFSVKNFAKAYELLKRFLDTNNLFEKFKNEFYLKFKSSLKGNIKRITQYSTSIVEMRHLLTILHNEIIKIINLEDFLKYCNLHYIYN